MCEFSNQTITIPVQYVQYSHWLAKPSWNAPAGYYLPESILIHSALIYGVDKTFSNTSLYSAISLDRQWWTTSRAFTRVPFRSTVWRHLYFYSAHSPEWNVGSYHRDVHIHTCHMLLAALVFHTESVISHWGCLWPDCHISGGGGSGFKVTGTEAAKPAAAVPDFISTFMSGHRIFLRWGTATSLHW